MCPLHTLYFSDEVKQLVRFKFYYGIQHNMVKRTHQNDESNIDSDDDRFYHFKEELAEVTNKLIQNRKFSDMDKIKWIIGEIEKMHERFKNELIEKIHVVHKEKCDIRSVNQNLASFYDPFFEKYQDDSIGMMKYLREKSLDYFLNKKIYQLSHFHGIYKDDIKGKDKFSLAFQTYFLLQLYVDYYEIFPKYLLPIIIEEKEHLSDNVETDNISYYFYKRIKEVIKKPILLDWKKMEIQSSLRNSIAHASIIMENDNFISYNMKKIEDWYSVKNESNKHSVEETLDYIYCFNRLLIVYSTELDLRLLNLAPKNQTDDFFKVWVEYFKIYNNGWQKIGKRNKSSH